jgi:hypothetical protein
MEAFDCCAKCSRRDPRNDYFPCNDCGVLNLCSRCSGSGGAAALCEKCDGLLRRLEHIANGRVRKLKWQGNPETYYNCNGCGLDVQMYGDISLKCRVPNCKNVFICLICGDTLCFDHTRERTYATDTNQVHL